MKVLFIGNEARTRKYLPALPIVDLCDLVVMPRDATEDEILAVAADADVVVMDAITPMSRNLMRAMPNLKLVHSEGVAFNAIDINAASELGIPVCNNRGVNAVSVAEQTLLLMLAISKFTLEGDTAVRAGQQIETKERLMVSGIGEISGSTVGLIGFGDIAREVAKRCNAFGARVLYNKRTRLSGKEEAILNVEYAELDELLAQSDFVSIHTPVTPQTEGMCNDAFFGKMKEGSYFINTARGEMVDNHACLRALASGKLAGAGFDTIAPEPVQADNPLVDLPQELKNKVVFSPHIGGVTSNMFYRAHRAIWENVARVAAGEEPINIVNR